MQWNNELCLKLIELYKQNRCLWDSHNEEFKDNAKKEDVWRTIATSLDCGVEECRKKLESLLASFRRERLKTLLPKSSRHEGYESKWFAFAHLQFLLDKYKPRAASKAQATAVDPLKIEIVDKGTETPNFDNNQTGLFFQQEEESLHSRKKRRVNEVEDTSKILRNTSNQSRNLRDASTVFGEYVGKKLQNYSEYTRNTVEHLISNLLFNADMGWYDDPQSATIPSARYQSSRTPTPSLHNQASQPESPSSQHCQSPAPIF